MPNAWDAGSSRVLAGLGFQAVATSSGACANVLGKLDGSVTREEAFAHAKACVDAVEIPVSADLEKCVAARPEDAAETIRRAAALGIAGGSIEDASGNPDKPIYDFALAVERVAAAAQAAKASGFVLTARAENFLNKRADLDDTLKRLQAFEKAGADVLFAPGLPDLVAVRAACSAVKKPVSFMVAIPGKSFSVAELADCGVRRISFATSLYRAAMSGLIAAATEIRDKGTFGYLERSLPSSEIGKHMRR